MIKNLQKMRQSLETNGIRFKQLNITFTNGKIRDEVKIYFEPILKTPGIIGLGMLRYEGYYNEEGSLFVGRNRKLKNYIICFYSEKGLEQFEIFRKDFLNLAKNQQFVSEMSISNLQVSYVMSPPVGLKTPDDLTKTYENTIQVQQKSLPKVSISKDGLLVGGAVAQTTVYITGLVSADQSLKKIVVNLKAKDRISNQLMQYFIKSIDTDSKTIIAFLILKRFGRVTLSDFLKTIRDKLIKEFPVGNVIDFVQENSRATTSSGKYVLRALSGVKNKLKNKKTSTETQNLVLNWLSDVCNNLQPENFEEHQLFVTNIKQLVNSVSVPTRSPLSQTVPGNDPLGTFMEDSVEDVGESDQQQGGVTS